MKIGDVVMVEAREPMPNEMREELKNPQIIKIVDHPFYEFESGWSVNIERGDKLTKQVK